MRNTWLIVCVIATIIVWTNSKCYRKVNTRWRHDGRCGKSFPLANGRRSECDPKSDRPCCSDFGFCGNSPFHCHCSSCYDYRNRPGDVCQIVCDEESGLLDSKTFTRDLSSRKTCYIDLQRPTLEFCGVSLQVSDLDIGKLNANGYCENSWISMPSCMPETDTRICGNQSVQSYQYLYQRRSSAIRFRVHSNHRRYGVSSFKIRYKLLRTCPGPFQSQSPPVDIIPRTTSTPCYTRITDLKGTINTPFYPSQYPDNLNCVYEFIRVKPNICGVLIKPIRFAMEDPITTPFGGACTDFLHVPSCSFLCGKMDSTWKVEYQPRSRSIILHLHTDGAKNGTTNLGFLLKFQQLTKCN